MRRVVHALLALVVALAVGGCGDKENPVTEAETEGLYVTAGGLKYQVQLSRELNPVNPEDRELLKEVPEDVEPPGPNQLWFGVWLRVENDRSTPRRTAEEFEIKDTVGNTYEPIEIEPEDRIVAYEPTVLGGDELYPQAGSLAAQHGPKDGALLLFKLDRDLYYNRPAEFEILSREVPHEVEASVGLDL